MIIVFTSAYFLNPPILILQENLVMRPPQHDRPTAGTDFSSLEHLTRHLMKVQFLKTITT